MRKETSEEELLSPQKLQQKIKALRWNTLFLNISCIFLAIGGIKLRNDLTELHRYLSVWLWRTPKPFLSKSISSVDKSTQFFKWLTASFHYKMGPAVL